MSLLRLYDDEPRGVRKGLAILAAVVLPPGVLMFNGLLDWMVGTVVVLALIWGLLLVESLRARRK